MNELPEERRGAVGAARCAVSATAARARRWRGAGRGGGHSGGDGGGDGGGQQGHHPEPRVVHVPMTDTLRERVRERHNYRGNRTTTTKYNALTFMPKALFEQYR